MRSMAEWATGNPVGSNPESSVPGVSLTDVPVPKPSRGHPGYGRFTPLWFLAPAVVALAAIGIYPTLFALVTSLRQYNIARVRDGFPFVGLANYQQVLTDPTFWQTLGRTGAILLRRPAVRDALRPLHRAAAAPAGPGLPARPGPRVAGDPARHHLRGGGAARAPDLQSRLRRRQQLHRPLRLPGLRLARRRQRRLRGHLHHGRVAVDALLRADLPVGPLDGAGRDRGGGAARDRRAAGRCCATCSCPICCPASPPC